MSKIDKNMLQLESDLRESGLMPKESLLDFRINLQRFLSNMSTSKANGESTENFDRDMMSYVKYGFKNYGDDAAKRKSSERLPTQSIRNASSHRLNTYGGEDAQRGSVCLEGQYSFPTARLRIGTEPNSNVFTNEDGNQGGHSMQIAEFNQTVRSKMGPRPISFVKNPTKDTYYIEAVKSFSPAQQLQLARQSARSPGQALG